MTDWTIRSYRSEDAAAIARIFAYYVNHTVISFEEQAPSAAVMAERAAAICQKSPYLIAEQEGQIIGYAYAKPWSAMPAYARSYESTIYLAHDRSRQRSKGLGTALYRQLLDTLPQHTAIRSLYGIVTAGNTASEKMHEKLGFRKISTLPGIGCKFGQWLDVNQWLYEYYSVDNSGN